MSSLANSRPAIFFPALIATLSSPTSMMQLVMRTSLHELGSIASVFAACSGARMVTPAINTSSAIVRHEMKFGRILQGDAGDFQMLDARQNNQIRARQRVAGFLATRGLGRNPPFGARTVNRSLTGDFDVRQILAADEGRERAFFRAIENVAPSHIGRQKISRLIRRLERRPCVEAQRGFGPQRERPAQINSRRKLHRAATGAATVVQGFLNGGSVGCLAVAFCAKLADIKYFCPVSGVERNGKKRKTRAEAMIKRMGRESALICPR